MTIEKELENALNALFDKNLKELKEGNQNGNKPRN